MTPLTDLVRALVECASPVNDMLDEMAFSLGATDPDTATALLRDVLSPLAVVMAERDIRGATVLLEAAAPLIAGNLSLLAPVAEAG